MITVEEYLGQHGAGHEAELTDQMRVNADVIVGHANALLAAFGEDRGLRSGWRPRSVNARIPHAAMSSKHITCQAIDIEDDDGRLKAWVTPSILERHGLYMEYGQATPSWLHVQCGARGGRGGGMNKQRGHFDLHFLYWGAAIIGAIFTTGGIWLLIVAARGLL